MCNINSGDGGTVTTSHLCFKIRVKNSAAASCEVFVNVVQLKISREEMGVRARQGRRCV